MEKKLRFYGFLLLFMIALFTASCGALIRNEAQYDNGDWDWWATSPEVARIKQDKLALRKLEALPVQTASVGENNNIIHQSQHAAIVKTNSAVTKGYKGILFNFNKYNQYNFKITGPEIKSYLIGKNESVTDFLIPGTYACTVYKASRQQGEPWIFHVNAQQHYFRGEEYHWYVYME